MTASRSRRRRDPASGAALLGVMGVTGADEVSVDDDTSANEAASDANAAGDAPTASDEPLDAEAAPHAREPDVPAPTPRPQPEQRPAPTTPRPVAAVPDPPAPRPVPAAPRTAPAPRLSAAPADDTKRNVTYMLPPAVAQLVRDMRDYLNTHERARTSGNNIVEDAILLFSQQELERRGLDAWPTSDT